MTSRDKCYRNKCEETIPEDRDNYCSGKCWKKATNKSPFAVR